MLKRFLNLVNHIYIYIRKPWAIFITGKEKSYNIKLILYFIKKKISGIDYCPSTQYM